MKRPVAAKVKDKEDAAVTVRLVGRVEAFGVLGR